MADEKTTKTSEETQVPEKKEKKKSKKDAELEALKTELDQKADLLARTAAEFDNYKKRTERERVGISEFAKAEVLKKLLPILDNIDRAAATESGTEEYLKGIELIIKQFLSLKEGLGLTPIAKKGDAFDPNFHEAVMHIEDESYGENVIAEVLQQGYKIGDTVIRAAMVQVAN